MKRIALAGLLIAAAAFTSAPASAAQPTIQDFVDDCADNVVHVDGTQRYVGGSAELNDFCRVIPEPGATFVLRGVTLTGTGDLIATTGPVSGADVTLKVIDSEITLDGYVELAAGAAAGDQLVPEENGRVVIRNSTVSGRGVLATASFDYPDGTVVIRNSTVTATDGNIQVSASEVSGADGKIRITDSTLVASGNISIRAGTDYPSGDDGIVRVLRSTLDAGGETLIDSGPDGRTVVKTTIIPGTPVTITTGLGGFCKTVDLTPAIACS